MRASLPCTTHDQDTYKAFERMAFAAGSKVLESLQCHGKSNHHHAAFGMVFSANAVINVVTLSQSMLSSVKYIFHANDKQLEGTQTGESNLTQLLNMHAGKDAKWLLMLYMRWLKSLSI